MVNKLFNKALKTTNLSAIFTATLSIAIAQAASANEDDQGHEQKAC